MGIFEIEYLESDQTSENNIWLVNVRLGVLPAHKSIFPNFSIFATLLLAKKRPNLVADLL